MKINVESSDLLVFCHLRWDFVFQRPQHLMSRFAKHRRVFFIEAPVVDQNCEPKLLIQKSKEDVIVVTPYITNEYSDKWSQKLIRNLLDQMLSDFEVGEFTSWYYNPMALMISDHLKPKAVIYDCMDELSGFKDCPKEMRDWEKTLLSLADVVFTGGNSIYRAKKNQHPNIHPFPSSIDQAHFHQARAYLPDPEDQKNIPHPRIGFYGVIEERIDLELLEGIASLRPDYQFIMVGPVIRLDESLLPRLPNIHYLGKKDYQELPQYLSNWDCAMMPFAINDATKYISPTKTPEFLAAGCPVVSTPVNDVVHPWASEAELIFIADHPEGFVECIDLAMEEKLVDSSWINRVDAFLDGNTWDRTFAKMAEHELKLQTQIEEDLAINF